MLDVDFRDDAGCSVLSRKAPADPAGSGTVVQGCFEMAAVVFISTPGPDCPVSQTAPEMMPLHRPMEMIKAMKMYFMRVVIGLNQFGYRTK